MSLPRVVSVPPYDPSCKSGPATLLSVEANDCVKVKFIVSGGRACVVPLSRLRAKDREAVLEWRSRQVMGQPKGEPKAEPKAEPKGEPEREPEPEWEPLEPELSTWHRLLSYGALCKRGHTISCSGMRALWGLVLPHRAGSWLDKESSLPLDKLLSHFVDVWWRYCCACSHADEDKLNLRQRIFVLELMCVRLQRKKSRHTCVFGALLMQVVVLFCHDQSICYIGADLDNVGYNHRVDCAKIGPVVRASALCRHESTSECVSFSLSKVRNPKKPIVWLLQRPSMKFRRLRKYKLFSKFADGEGGYTRMEPGTNRIMHWNEELEDHVYAEDFHTTLDGVEFKRCGDQLRPGDTWLESGSREWLVLSIEPDGSCSHPPHVVCLKGAEGQKRSMRCPFDRMFAVGTTKYCEDAVRFLRGAPDVVDTLCLSTGHPLDQMRTSRSRVKMSEVPCDEAPILCSWKEYLLWRCAVSITVSLMDKQCQRVAMPYAKRARLAWLFGKD